MSIEKFFTTGITVQRRTITRDAAGGTIETWADHLSISGRIRQLSGDDRLSADKDTVFATHRMYCMLADIVETDRVVFSGITYAIKFIENPMLYGRFLQIDLELVK